MLFDWIILAILTGACVYNVAERSFANIVAAFAATIVFATIMACERSSRINRLMNRKIF
jgi:hypothetical protein